MEPCTSYEVEDERQKLQHDIQRIQDTLYEDSYSDYDSDSDAEGLEIDLEKRFQTDDDTRTRSSIGASSTSQFGGTEISDVTEFDAEDLVTPTSGTSLPITTESSLALNRAYQEVILDLLEQISKALDKNRLRQKTAEDELVGKRESNISSAKERMFYKQYAIPYIKDPLGGVPPPNEDTNQKRIMKEHKQDVQPEREWLTRDKNRMYDFIAEDCLQQLTMPLMIRLELEQEKLERCSKEEEGGITERIEGLEKDIEEKRTISTWNLVKMVNVEKVDWLKISNIAYEGRKTWEECKMVWINLLNPTVNRARWTSGEDKKLEQLVEASRAKNWELIAANLNTGRTPFMCLQRYQMHINPWNTQREWRYAEDCRLLELVQDVRQRGHRLNWSKVSSLMENRSSGMCVQRFQQIDPEMRRGPWTEDEDMQLYTAMNICGPIRKWGRIAEFVTGRTPIQCRDRWQNSLNPDLRMGNWSYEEDKKLLKAVKKYGTKKWTRVSQELEGRTDNMVLQRFKRLEMWKRKSQWFEELPEGTKRALMGGHLPVHEQRHLESLSFEALHKHMCVKQEDYGKQQIDKERGDMVVPRPPPLLGYGTKVPTKIIDKRLNLMNIIMKHVRRIRGGQIDQELMESQEVAARFQYGNASLPVKKLLELSKDVKGKLDILNYQRKPSLPLPQKKRRYNVQAMSRKSKLEVALKESIQTIYKLRRRFKKGRPRRFFNRFATTDEEEVDTHTLKVKSLNLVMKALDVDPQKMLKSATRYKKQSSSDQGNQSSSNQGNQSSSNQGKQSSSNQGKQTTSQMSTSARCQGRQSCKQTPRKGATLTKVKQKDVRKDENLDKSMEVKFLDKTIEERTHDESIETEGEMMMLQFVSESQNDAGDVEIVISSTPISNKNNSSPIIPMAVNEEAPKDTERNKMAAVGDESTDSHEKEVQGNSLDVASSSKKCDPLPSTSSAGSQVTDLSDGESENKDTDYKLPLLPPNWTNMKGFKTLLLNRRKNIKSAGNMYNPSLYIKKKPQNYIHTTEEEASSSSKSSHQALLEIRQTKDYQMLKARFRSIFLWPSLMSAITPPFERNQLEPGTQVNPPPPRKKTKPLTYSAGRKRNYKKRVANARNNTSISEPANESMDMNETNTSLELTNNDTLDQMETSDGLPETNSSTAADTSLPENRGQGRQKSSLESPELSSEPDSVALSRTRRKGRPRGPINVKVPKVEFNRNLRQRKEKTAPPHKTPKEPLGLRVLKRKRAFLGSDIRFDMNKSVLAMETGDLPDPANALIGKPAQQINVQDNGRTQNDGMDALETEQSPANSISDLVEQHSYNVHYNTEEQESEKTLSTKDTGETLTHTIMQVGKKQPAEVLDIQPGKPLVTKNYTVILASDLENLDKLTDKQEPPKGKKSKKDTEKSRKRSVSQDSTNDETKKKKSRTVSVDVADSQIDKTNEVDSNDDQLALKNEKTSLIPSNKTKNRIIANISKSGSKTKKTTDSQSTVSDSADQPAREKSNEVQLTTPQQSVCTRTPKPPVLINHRGTIRMACPQVVTGNTTTPEEISVSFPPPGSSRDPAPNEEPLIPMILSYEPSADGTLVGVLKPVKIVTTGGAQQTSVVHDGTTQKTCEVHDGKTEQTSVVHKGTTQQTSVVHDGTTQQTSVVHDGTTQQTSVVHDGIGGPKEGSAEPSKSS